MIGYRYKWIRENWQGPLKLFSTFAEALAHVYSLETNYQSQIRSDSVGGKCYPISHIRQGLSLLRWVTTSDAAPPFNLHGGVARVFHIEGPWVAEKNC